MGPGPRLLQPVDRPAARGDRVSLQRARGRSRRWLRPRPLGPEIDLFDVRPPAGIAELAMDPTEPLPFLSTTALLDRLPDTAIDEVVQLASPVGSPILLTQFRHLGGAISRPAVGGGARDFLAGEIGVFAVGVVPDPALHEPVRSALAALATAVAPQEVGRYANFVEHPADASVFWDAPDWARLRTVKSLYDPNDLFLGNHRIPPLA